jgi:hypothetical protein
VPWNVRVIESGYEHWGVRFNVEHQAFTLDYRTEIKEEAEWMRDQMIVALNRLLDPVHRRKV